MKDWMQKNYVGDFYYEELRSAVTAAWEQIPVKSPSDLVDSVQAPVKQIFELML